MSNIPPMIQYYDVLQAARRARIAVRNGDLAAAERWYRIADRAASISLRLAELARSDERSKWKIVHNPV